MIPIYSTTVMYDKNKETISELSKMYFIAIENGFMKLTITISFAGRNSLWQSSWSKVKEGRVMQIF